MMPKHSNERILVFMKRHTDLASRWKLHNVTGQISILLSWYGYAALVSDLSFICFFLWDTDAKPGRLLVGAWVLTDTRCHVDLAITL